MKKNVLSYLVYWSTPSQDSNSKKKYFLELPLAAD